jgi:hypothetical protein
MPSALVLSHVDSQPHELKAIFQSNGQWNFVVFGGKIAEEQQQRRVKNLAAALSSPKSIAQSVRARSVRILATRLVSYRYIWCIRHVPHMSILGTYQRSFVLPMMISGLFMEKFLLVRGVIMLVETGHMKTMEFRLMGLLCF